MRARLVLLFAIVAFTLPFTAPGQQLPVQMDLDVASFAYDDAQSMLEVNLSFGAHSLDYRQEASGFVSRLPFELQILKGGDAVWRDTTALVFVTPDTAALHAGQFFLHRRRAVLAPGTYNLRLRVPKDEATGRSELEMRREVVVADYGKNDAPRFSDLTLAGAVAPSQDREDPFYKNGLTVRPNPGMVFGQGMDNLFYYIEAYDVNPSTDEGKYTARAWISESTLPSALEGFEKRFTRDARETDILVGEFDVSTLPTGSYVLNLEVSDAGGLPAINKTRKFYIYNPGVARPDATTGVEVAYESSIYARIAEADVTEELGQIEYIANDRELRTIKDLRLLDEKRRFLKEFWDKRSTRPGAAYNEYREEFKGRIRYANDRFADRQGPGWKSDRGRVIIKYGSPTNIELHQFDPKLLSYEVWSYNNIPGEGQAIFVFADRNGYGDYEQIHSTVRGEHAVADWERELQK